MAEKRLNCGINKTLIMATKITVPDIGDFENVEIIEILTKISIISTFSKSPISGTVISVAIIDVLFIPQFNPFSAM